MQETKKGERRHKRKNSDRAEAAHVKHAFEMPVSYVPEYLNICLVLALASQTEHGESMESLSGV